VAGVGPYREAAETTGLGNFLKPNQNKKGLGAVQKKTLPILYEKFKNLK
jgi:hypothetical protein